MTRLLIIGAGGLGREFLQYAEDCHETGNFFIGGFIDNDANALDGFDVGYEVVGDDDYTPEPDDRFVIAIGDPDTRARLAANVVKCGGKLQSLIHTRAYIAPNSTIHEGAVIAPFAFVGVDARLDENVFLNIGAIAGHNVTIGAHSVLSGGAAVNGDAAIGMSVVLGPNAVVTPGVTIGANSRVAANSVVYRDVGENCIALGNPAKARPMIRKSVGSS